MTRKEKKEERKRVLAVLEQGKKIYAKVLKGNLPIKPT